MYKTQVAFDISWLMCISLSARLHNHISYIKLKTLIDHRAVKGRGDASALIRAIFYGKFPTSPMVIRHADIKIEWLTQDYLLYIYIYYMCIFKK